MSLFEQLAYLVEMIVSSPLTIFLLFIICGFVALLIAEIKSNDKTISKILVYGFLTSTILVAFIYNKSILMLLDSFMDKVFETIFFPNIVTYVLILVFINALLITLLLKNKVKEVYKVITFIATVQIDFLAILTLNTITKNDINIYSELTLYSDKTLLVLLQFTTEIFVLWLIIMFMATIINNLISMKNKELRKQNLGHIKNLMIRKKNNFEIKKNEKLYRKEVIDFVEEEKQG
jgi:hypothetical protein